MTNKIEQFLNDKFGEVGAVKIGDVIWFVASDVAKVLGYSSTQKVTDKVDDEDKEMFSVKTNGGIQSALCINKNGLHKTLSSNRQLSHKDKNELYKILTGEEYIDVITREVKESKFINILDDALKPFGLSGIKQFKVLDKYRLDFYIPMLDIAVEFDENSHRGYCKDAHENRQEEIENELGIKFIRVTDNYSDAYNVGLVLSKIVNHLVPTYVKSAMNDFKEFLKAEELKEMNDNEVIN